MPSIDIDIRVFNATLAAILTGVVGLLPLIKLRNRLTWLFALSNLALVVWNLGDAVVLIPESHSAKLWLFRSNYISGVFLVWLFYQFAFAFAKIEIKRFKNFWKILKYTGLFLVFLSISPFLVSNIDETVRPFKEIPGPAYPLFIVFLIGGLGLALYQLFVGYRSSEGIARTRLKYMFLALFFSFLEAIIFFLTLYFKKIPPYYFYLQVVYALIVAYAIAVHRVMDIELLGRNATGWFFAGLLSVLPFIVAVILARFIWIRPYFALSSSPGTLLCSILDFSLALTTIRIVQNPHARRLCRLLFLIGAWNLTELILDIPPNSFSVMAYRFSYGVACLVGLAWFSYWRDYFGEESHKLKKAAQWLTGSAWAAFFIAGFTPLVLKSLTFSLPGGKPADEVPGPAYPIFSLWFLVAGLAMAIWPVSGWWKSRLKARSLGPWVAGSFLFAISSSAAYFLFVQGKLSWFWYSPLQFFLCFFLMGSLVSRMEPEEGRPTALLARHMAGFGLSILVVSLCAGFLLAQGSWLMAIGGFLGGAFMAFLTGAIRQPVQEWVDQTFVFRKEFGHVLRAQKIAGKDWNLDSLEEALPLVAQEVLKTTPYKACTIAIMFDDQPKRPFFRATQIRLAQGELISGLPWSEQLVLAFLQLIRQFESLLLREELKELPQLIRELDPLLFEAAVPLKTDGKVVGVVVMGPKEGRKSIFHDEDMKILNTLAKTLSQRLGPSVGLNLFRCIVNNTLHDVLGHDMGPLVDQLGMGYPISTDMTLQGLRRVREVLKGLRAYAQGELEKGRTKEPEPLDMERLLKGVYQMHRAAAEKKGLQFFLKIPSSLPHPRLDPTLVERCIGNLVTNSIKYTLQGSIELSVQVEERFLVVCVTDTGIGIPKEFLNLIFEAGYRVPGQATQVAEGTGIGLANVQEIMAAIGGRVRVESEPAQGSRFFLHFPLPAAITEVKATA